MNGDTRAQTDGTERPAAGAPVQGGEDIIDRIADIFARRGAESYLGEAVSMAGHMLQAARLAEAAGAPDALIAGALLHDIGHFTGEFPVDALAGGQNNYHDETGAAILEPWMPAPTTACVRHHVRAKRYLCTVAPDYRQALSPASIHSLALQGGDMSADEVAAFARQPYLDAILAVRRWDDAAKVRNRAHPPFDHYAALLRRLVGTGR